MKSVGEKLVTNWRAADVEASELTFTVGSVKSGTPPIVKVPPFPAAETSRDRAIENCWVRGGSKVSISNKLSMIEGYGTGSRVVKFLPLVSAGKANPIIPDCSAAPCAGKED